MRQTQSAQFQCYTRHDESVIKPLAPEYPFSLGICAYVFDVVNEMDGLEIQLVQHHLSVIYLFSLALQ